MIPAALLLVLLLVEQAEALGEPQICYILDAILFLYGIILTLLYCRLKIQVRKAAVAYQVWMPLPTPRSQQFADSALLGYSLGEQESRVLTCMSFRDPLPTSPYPPCHPAKPQVTSPTLG
uniref:Fc of IgE receptor Ig n=1 Tax=Pipistrellus kuhlii TaxID=59472 RepID=A0A7J7QXP3_PIPKU|nr:Fc fragment of IgE receptor Ig [Pipistrellus kuhlii]